MTAVIVAVLVVLVTSAVQGAVGFGMNLLAVPVLVLVDPRLVPGPVLLAGLALAFLVAVREREPLERQLGWALLGLVPGTAAALTLLSLVPPDALGLPMGVLVLLAVMLSALRLELSPTPPSLSVAGTASGFLATAAGIGGPPLALLYARAPGPRLRGNLSGFFVVTAAVSLLALVLTGHFGLRDLRLSLPLVVGALAGFVASGPLRSVVDRGHTRGAVLLLSAAAALVAIGEGLRS